MGIAYFLPSWFRYGQMWIHDRMHELESKEGVYSLEGWQQGYLKRVAREVAASRVRGDRWRGPIHVQPSLKGLQRGREATAIMRIRAIYLYL